MTATTNGHDQIPLFRSGGRKDAAAEGRPLKTAGLFSGIGGIELGLHRAGHETLLLCENEPGAREVLRACFPNVEIHDDVRDLRRLPDGTELLAGGVSLSGSLSGR